MFHPVQSCEHQYTDHVSQQANPLSKLWSHLVNNPSCSLQIVHLFHRYKNFHVHHFLTRKFHSTTVFYTRTKKVEANTESKTVSTLCWDNGLPYHTRTKRRAFHSAYDPSKERNQHP